MKKFITPKDSNDIHVNIDYQTKAVRYRSVGFYLVDPLDINSFEILDNDDRQTTHFSKSAANVRSILHIRIQFIVDIDQLPNKPQIMEETIVDFNLSDRNGSDDTFVSNFNVDPLEYNNRTKHLFTITKKVEIVLT